jgi:RIO-like serine/threonine protein kinase
MDNHEEIHRLPVGLVPDAEPLDLLQADGACERLYTKKNVSLKEYQIHKLAEDHFDFVPKIFSYNMTTLELKMQLIKPMCIADFYGDESHQLPSKIFEEIRRIIKMLMEIGIIYQDITGYNFIEDSDGKVWIIDFGDALLFDPFVNKFLNGSNNWNKNYR